MLVSDCETEGSLAPEKACLAFKAGNGKLLA